MHGTALTLAVLGATKVERDGMQVALRQRELQLLAALALHRGTPASLLTLADAIWLDALPMTARQALHNQVSRVRQTLGESTVVTEPSGYRLGDDWQLDIDAFERHVGAGRRSLQLGDHFVARAEFEAALMLTRGTVYSDLAETDGVLAARFHHHEQHRLIEDDHLLALLAGGDVVGSVATAKALAEAEPFREFRWAALALALYRNDQRRESLRALRRGREMLIEVAGLEPGPTLLRLESLVLDDDAALKFAAPASLTGRHESAWLRGHGLASFVGRSEELARVASILAEASSERRGRWIDVCGPVGIGKSEFARQVAQRAALDGWSVGAATCHAIPAEVFEPLSVLVAGVMGAGAPSTNDDRQSGSDDATVLGDVLAAQAARFPLLLVVDDAQHLRAPTEQLLRRIVDGPAPIVVMACRPSTGRSREVGDESVELAALLVDEVAALLSAITSVQIPVSAAELVHATTGGSPALVKHVASDPDSGADFDSIGIEARVWRLSEITVSKLADPARAVATILAVASCPMTLDALGNASALDPEVVASIVDDPSNAGAFRVEGDGNPSANRRLILQSDALRTWLLAQLDGDARLDIEERIGLALVAHGGTYAAAAHLMRVPDRHPDLTIRVASQAARAAFDGAMYAEAVQLLEPTYAIASSHLGAQHRTTRELRLALGECLRMLGDPTSIDLMWAAVRDAEAAGDGDALAGAVAALCRLGQVSQAGTLDDEVARVVERAIAECHDHRILADCAGQATLFYSMSGRVDLCRSYFDVALDHARASGDDRVLLGAFGNVYVSLMHPADWQLRRELAAEMLALAERLDDDDARCQALHLAFSTQVQYCDPMLRTTFARQEALAGTLQSAPRRWMASYQRACLAFLDGDLDGSHAIAERAFADAPVAQSRALSTFWMNLLVVRLAQGRAVELRSDIDSIIDQQPGLPGWRAVAAWLAAVVGDVERVHEECEAIDDGHGVPHDMSWNGAVMLLGRAIATTGDQTRVARVTELLRPWSGLMTWIGSQTVGPIDLALGELCLAAGNIEGARHHLALARRSIDLLGAVVYRPELERLAGRLA